MGNMRVAKIGQVSIWLGQSVEDFDIDKYVELAYDENGEIVPSQFMVDFDLDPWDENYREAALLEGIQTEIALALDGFSYAATVTAEILAADIAPSQPFNAMILLYDFRFRGKVKRASHAGIDLAFFACVPYRKPRPASG